MSTGTRQQELEALQRAAIATPVDAAAAESMEESSLSPQLENPIVPTHRVASQALNELEVPGPRDRFPTNRLTSAPAHADRLSSAAANAGIAGNQPMARGPLELAGKKETNPGLLMTRLGLAFEGRHAEEIAKLHSEIRKSKEKMDDLLKLSGELQKLSPDAKTHALTDSLKAHFTALKVRGIDLLDEKAEEITADQLIQIRATISQHLDSIKSIEMQQPLMRSQKLTSELQSLYQSLQKILQLLDRLIQRTQNKVGR